MNWADFAILAIIGISVVVSFYRGFIRETLSLLVWVLAFWVAWTYSSALTIFFAKWVSTPSLQIALAFTLLMALALLAGGLFTWIIGNIVNKTGLGGTDRVVGLVFGAARGILIVVILVLLAHATPFTQDSWWTSSKLIPQFEQVADRLKEILPTKVKNYLDFSATSTNDNDPTQNEPGLEGVDKDGL